METITRSTGRCKACGANSLHEERVEWLYEYLKRRDFDLALDGETYRFMRCMNGFSKGELDRCIATLRDRGLVRLRGLFVEVIEAATCPV